MQEKHEVFNWIKKIIQTCNNDFHFEGVNKLIELFANRFKDDEMTTELELIKAETWNKIHDIL